MRNEYAVNIEVFQGPLSVLLELIEKQTLEISNVSLGSITEDFLRHIEQVEEIAPHEVADFLLVAGRLLYLKSKLLLPGLAIEEDEDVDLTGQLKLYQRFAEAATIIADRAASQRVAYTAPRLKIEIPAFSPPTLTAEELAAAVRALTERVKPYVDLPEKMLQRTVTVEEKIEQLKARIQQEATIYFHDVTQRGSKSDIVASFLALLELLKQDILRVEQKGHFDDISITRV
ncbi:hypothetical protein COV06_02740 [Candidatus Uhrbacteria bacterium CG10_big_fil_rev_8_21_14_0_10_50_16]|uniref:Segregation and condensation protein A n=1 Tax=Candidatus Uhrbacteria bacterium CG10_big_fil_rev_8_21_14_0_10_50_16 TaxID=1975039 RepID=A0A2H0RMA9_9BACT|nr:MAG: hypothetical protein COV06_02740 [Candidatus Uhrbacteria bacterium CG10_big_fil_rev_8_21_14_0_10_50_16]